jgi:hypothetical protein
MVGALALWPATQSLAQNAASSYIVQIRTGGCGNPGDGIAQLADLTLGSESAVGAPGAAAAASSYSVAPVSLDSLTGSDAAIFVLDGDTRVLVACGEIGGVMGGDGALPIGLRQMNDSGLTGIVYLAPNAANPAETGVSTFLAATGSGSGAPSGDAPAEPMEAEAYASVIKSQLTVLVGSLQRISALFDNPDAASSAWVSQVGGELFLWKLLYRVAQEVEPPSDYAAFDEQYLGALALLDSAATDIMQALQNGDEALLAEASAKIQEAVGALRSLQSSQPSASPVAGTPTP